MVNEENQTMGCTELSPEMAKILSPDRLRILKALSSSPKYPVQLSRELNIPVQLVYYNVRILEKAGFIAFSDYEEKNGGIAKKYYCTSDSFVLVITDSWRGFLKQQQNLPKFLAPFVRNSLFDAKIIIGSPEPHGKYRARASDLGALELTMFLGRYASFSFPAYMLDTQFTNMDKNGNFILIGGPKVNMAVSELNVSLPINFRSNDSEVFSKLSGKSYSGNVGIILLAKNPQFRSSNILLVGGLNYHGTRAAIVALVQKTEKIDGGNMFNSSLLAHVVEGFDEDGDGLVDSVEILE